MIKANEYFDGQVKSLAFETDQGPATVGVIAPGEYEFNTSSREIITMVSGRLEALLPGHQEWSAYEEGESFEVASGLSFRVRAGAPAAYRCLYR
jgi:purine/pyrimidine-nucleoside phosphorylase